MKYQPAIRLHDPAVNAAFYRGEMHLHPGQWLDINGDGKLSRFAYATYDDAGHVQYVRAYHGGSSGDAHKQYLLSCACDRYMKAKAAANRAARELERESKRYAKMAKSLGYSAVVGVA